MGNRLERWMPAEIVEYFVKNPLGTIQMSTTDKITWINNTDNKIMIGRQRHTLSFKEISKGVHEASLK